MKSGLVYLRPWRLVYSRQVGPYETTIPLAWDNLLGWLEKNGIKAPLERGFGVMRDSPGIVSSDQCRYDACVDIEPMFEERAMREMGVQTLPGGSYLRERNNGSYRGLSSELLKLYDTFQPPDGLQLDQRRPLVTIYLDDPRDSGVSDRRADICIPVTVHMQRQDLHGQEAA